MTAFIIGFILGAMAMFTFLVFFVGYHYYKAKYQAHLEGYETE